MRYYIKTHSKIMSLLQATFIFIWLSVLTETDSHYSVYVLCALVAMIALYDRHHCSDHSILNHTAGIHMLSIAFSMAVLLANYPIFLRIRNIEMIGYSRNAIINGMNAFGVLVGGYFVFSNIILWLSEHIPYYTATQSSMYVKATHVFFGSFTFFSLIYLGYLFLLEYPSHISVDSLSQITQAYTNTYISMHPFWHTMVIKLFMTIGYSLFGDVNAAAACYSVCQSLFMAACFAYVVTTLYQFGMRKWILAVCIICYGFLPYNIAFSITMWKDIPFSLGILVFATALFRYIKKIGTSQILNCILFSVATFLICLMRTNGIVTLGIATVIMFPVMFKKYKCLVIILVIVILLCCVLSGPVQAAFPQEEVPYAFLEPLSVPMQQIARVIALGYELTEEQIELINNVLGIERIPDLYIDYNVDQLKVAIWESDLTYLNENLDRYIKLWFDLGCKYPLEYVKAWIEQTKGYWNGGYDYYQFAEMMHENDFGLEKTGGIHLFVLAKYLIFGLARFTVLFQPFNSIGLHVWLLILCCYLNIRKKSDIYLICVPMIIIVLGLIVGTPVYAEFRYAYSVFITMPLVLLGTIFTGESDASVQPLAQP